jgi:hypothetical protein
VVSVVLNLAGQALRFKSNCRYLGQRCDALAPSLRSIQMMWQTLADSGAAGQAQVADALPALHAVREQFDAARSLIERAGALSALVRHVSATSFQQQFAVIDQRLTASVATLHLAITVRHEHAANKLQSHSESLSIVAALAAMPPPYVPEKTDALLEGFRDTDTDHELLTSADIMAQATAADLQPGEALEALDQAKAYLQSMAKLTSRVLTKQEAALCTIASFTRTSMTSVPSGWADSKQLHDSGSGLASPSAPELTDAVLLSPSSSSPVHSPVSPGVVYIHLVSNRSFLIRPDEIVLSSEVLGRGAFGIVRKATFRGDTVAVKHLVEDAGALAGASGQQVRACFEQEVAIMCSIKHPFLLLVRGACFEPKNFFIVTEWMEGGSLFDILHAGGPGAPVLSLRRRLAMSLDIACGVVAMHNNSPVLVHGDLKSHSVLLDRKGTCKLADFGLAKSVQAAATAVRLSTRRGSPPVDGGTLVYLSPALLSQDTPSADAGVVDDLYALGVLLWELFSSRIPWAGLREVQILTQVVVLKHRLPVLPSLPDELNRIIQQLMGPPEGRPTAVKTRQRLTEVAALLDEPGVQDGPLGQ